MATSNPCPRCGKAIVYRPNRWAPWQANQPFRCPNCATMLRLRPSWVTQVVRTALFATILAGEVALFAHDPKSRVNFAYLATALCIAVTLLTLRLTQTLHYILPHRLQACRED
jgi:hypothetical protein